MYALKNHSRALAAFNDYVALCPDSPAGYFFTGRSCLILGFLQKPVSFFEQALKRDTNNPLTMSFLGVAYLKARRSRSAVEMLQKAVETAPDNKRIYRAYLNALFIRGVRNCRNEDYELGSQMLRFVLENGKDAGFRAGALLHLELGRACREQGMLEEALEHYTRAQEHSPNDPMIRWYRSSILMELKRDGEALEDLSIIRSADSGIPDLPWNSELVDRYMILVFVRAEAWRRAAEACKNWLKKRGSAPWIHAVYAEVLRNLHSFTQAENHLKKALEADKECLELWYVYAMCAWESRNFPNLKKALEKAKKLNGDPDLLFRFSVLYESETSGDPLKTLERIQEALRRMEPDPDLMCALGKTYLRIGLLDEAISWFSKIIEQDKTHEASWLGVIAAREVIFNEEKNLRSQNALEKAYRDYLELWPDNIALLRDQALFLVKIHKYEQAAKKLETLLGWDQSNPGLRRVLAYSYRKTGRYRDAAVFLAALLRERPRDLRLFLEYSGCVARIGKDGLIYARTIMEKAMHVFTSASEIPTSLGLLAYKDGNFEKAFDYLREAVARNTKDPRPYHWMAEIAKSKGDKEGEERYRREALLRKG